VLELAQRFVGVDEVMVNPVAGADGGRRSDPLAAP
jgi:hypothetical protein